MDRMTVDVIVFGVFWTWFASCCTKAFVSRLCCCIEEIFHGCQCQNAYIRVFRKVQKQLDGHIYNGY